MRITKYARTPIRSRSLLCFAAALLLAFALRAQDDSNARPPVTQGDIEIVKHARLILNSPAVWNRADNRVCPAGQKTFSLYCALEKATDEVSGNFEHRGAAMQEARFVIEEMAPKRNYDHRLMGYNNDPTTTFNDVRRFFDLLEAHIARRLKAEPPPATDLAILRRVRALLDSTSHWDRADDQTCRAGAPKLSLFCAFRQASIEIAGSFNNSGVAIEETRAAIGQVPPHHAQYTSRLTDYNNDPSVSLADVQSLLKLVEDRLSKWGRL